MEVLIIGYFGYDNIGDEAILAAVLSELREQTDFNYSVLSYHADKTRVAHNVAALSRGKNLTLLRHIIKSDVIIVGGGSILQDVTSSLSLYYYAAILLLAKLFAKQTYLLGNGFGPIKKTLNRRLISWLIPSFDGVIARDEDAYTAFQKFGAKRLMRGVDNAFLLRPQDYQKPTDERPYVVISLRPWRHITRIKKAVAAALDFLVAQGYAIYLLPMKAPDDQQVMLALSAQRPTVEMLDHDYLQTLNYIKGAKFVIAMRLHALILATVFAKPVIGISYDPKVDSFIKQLASEFLLHASTIDEASLIAMVKELLSEYDVYCKKLTDASAANRRLAHQQVTKLLNWIDEQEYS